MVKIFDVAKYILETRGEMSTWKLQKLCYYCQAWHYTWTERRLIEESFQAWRNGPVCPELYEVLKDRFMINAEDFKFGDSSKLDADEKESVDVVLKEYGDLFPYELHEMAHQETPWIDTRGDLPKDENSTAEISLKSMGDYYGSVVYDA